MKLNITNREQIIEQLTEMLMQFDKDCNSYDTDIYLYYDEENQTAELDTFVNVGGNSWLNDSHYTIYTDKQHYDGMLDWYQTEAEFAEFLEIPLDKLTAYVKEYLDMDEDDEPNFSDYYEAIRHNDDYMEKLDAAYNDCIDEMQSEYVSKANEIMDRFDEWCENIED